MRFLSLVALIVYFIIPSLFVLAGPTPRISRDELGGIAILQVRDQAPSTITVRDPSSSDITTSTATSSTNATAITTANSTSILNTTAPASTTIVPLNTTAVSQNETHISAGTLPIQPEITPAFGVGGFILLATGALLAFIGIRNLWIQVFLSAAFLTSLGVTVLIVYVMKPPIRIAIQGAYLVTIFCTGATFGALSIVFKELTEGLGCLLGGFCTSMWLLCLKPGGLLAETTAKYGFIGGISAAFYALSFSRYTRPYGLIISTAISGGTAISLGIDCFSRAGLKEFWLYVWGLNNDMFPLGTDTYPITRNIRVELAIIVIVAVLGVISQLRLWRVVRERRQKEEEKRQEEEKRKEEAEAGAGRRMEEANMKERQEWEAKYDNSETDPVPELGDDTKCAADTDLDDLEKGEMKSIACSSQGSYRCSGCRERDTDYDAISDISGAPGSSISGQHEHIGVEMSEEQSAAPFRVFDGMPAARLQDDKDSDITALVGSETATIHSKDLSGRTLWRRKSARSSVKLTESQEPLIDRGSDSTLSAQVVIDEGSDRDFDHDSIAAEDYDETDKACPQPVDHTPSDTVVEEEEEGSPDLQKSLPEQNISPQRAEKERRITIDVRKHTDNEKTKGRKELVDDTQNEPVADKSEKPLINEHTTQAQSERPHSADRPEISRKTEPLSEDDRAGKPRDVITQIEKSEQLPTPSKGKDVAEPECEEPEEQSSEKTHDVQQSARTIEADDPKGVEWSIGTIKPNLSEPQVQKPLEEAGPSRLSSSTESPEVPAGIETLKGKSSASRPKSKAKPKKEIVKLDATTIQHLPERSSRIVQSYRTNEWAKHLSEAEIPGPEPIVPLVEEQLENPVAVEEVAAPVNLKELLQTPLNAEPPALETGKDQLSRNESHRISSDLQRYPSKNGEPRSPTRLSGTSSTRSLNIARHSGTLPSQLQPLDGLVGDIRNFSTNALAEQVREDHEPVKPKWKGPTPLLAIRENMVRNRLSFTSSTSLDPWQSRSSLRQSLVAESSTRLSSTTEGSDDVPLSQRRAMLHQQKTNTPVPPSPRWSQTSAPGSGNANATMAAWRESIQKDLRDRQDPLAKQDLATGVPSRSSSPFGQLQRTSPKNINISSAIAEGMQRGDMSELHREALRRMQAQANKNINGLVNNIE